MSNNKKSILDKLAEEVDKISEKLKPETEEKKKPKAKKPTRPITDETESIEDNTVMGKLMAESDIEILKVGDVVDGTVVDISSNSILLDLGPMGTGMVIGKEIKDGLNAGIKLKKGDKVNATIMDLENDEGYIELSIREASYEKAWDDLESKRDTQGIVTTKILDANKGGLMVEVNGISGFMPVSQLSSEHYPRVEDGDKNKILDLLKKLVGQELTVRILNADREAEKLIVSEKAAMSEKEKKVISRLQVGDEIEGEISGVVDFGAFVKFFPPGKENSVSESEKLEGLVHISELAWQLINNPKDIVKTGDKVKAKIIGIEDTRISLSMKALEKDPWENIGKKYNVGDIVKGKVDKINPFGAFVYLDKDIHGLAHVSEFKDVFPDKKMDEVLEEGKEYKWKILSIESKEHRMGLMFAKEEKVSAKKEEKAAPKTEEKKVEKKAKKEADGKKEKTAKKKEKAEKKKEEN